MYVALLGAVLEENLALRYLAPPLRQAGHDVRILGYDSDRDRERLIEQLAADEPDLIGISVAFQHRLIDFAGLVKRVREAGIATPIVWGGHIPTARSGQILERYPEVDLIVRHDGEETVVELANALQAEGGGLRGDAAPGSARVTTPALAKRLSQIEGLAFRLPEGRPGATPARRAVANLDSLSSPARDGRPAQHAGLGFVPILSSRGCWQHCTYCSIHTYHRGRQGARVRLRDPRAVGAEMAAEYFERKARIFCFHDENLFLPKPARTLSRLRAMRAELDDRGAGQIGIVAKCRPDSLSADLLRQAREIGVLRMYVGIENGSQNGLNHLGRDTTVAKCRESLRLLREAGIYACFNVLLFEPDTTLQDVSDNIAFLRDACDFPWNFCRAEVYPGSWLEKSLRDQDRLRGGLEGMTYTIADPRAELLFRICAIVYGGRNFGPQSVANLASGVGYLAAILTHFHGGRRVRTMHDKTQNLVRGLGEDTLAGLTRARDFVASNPTTDQVLRFTRALAQDVAAQDAHYWSALESMRRTMDRLGTRLAPRVLNPRSPAQTAKKTVAMLAAAATMATAAQGCGQTSVVDPLPPDTMVVDPPPPDVFSEDVMVADPLPDDVMVADPLPDDVIGEDAGDDEDIMVADPLPPDVVEADVVDEDADEEDDIMVADPLPPDVVQEDADEADDIDEPADAEEDSKTQDIGPPVDPPPPDAAMDTTSPSRAPDLAALPLDRAFRVTLRPRSAHVKSSEPTRLVAALPDGATLEWRAVGGSLQIDEDTLGATFVKNGAAPGYVLVTARDGDRLDVARWIG